MVSDILGQETQKSEQYRTGTQLLHAPSLW